MRHYPTFYSDLNPTLAALGEQSVIADVDSGFEIHVSGIMINIESVSTIFHLFHWNFSSLRLTLDFFFFNIFILFFIKYLRLEAPQGFIQF